MKSLEPSTLASADLAKEARAMEFWLVVGLIIGVVLAWAAISDHRARRYHRLRSHSEMAYDVHEHVRDVRAADMGSHLDQDQSWMHRPGSTPCRSSSGEQERP
jgi:hypothetical protein